MPLDPEKRQAFETECDQIVDQIVRHLLALTEGQWQILQLQLDAVLHPGGARSIQHRLWNPLTDETITDFPESLFAETNRLHDHFARHDQSWSRCLFTLRGQSGGQFSCTVDYYYPA